MPLLDRTEVSPLPLPSQLGQLPPDTELWLIAQTGEIFTDYESYANRHLFYSQPIFTPTAPASHHHQPVSFFQALNHEHAAQDELIQKHFPETLKQRITAAVSLQPAQRQPNIDHLVDYLYELFHNRFNVGDKVTVDLASSHSASPSVYPAKVVKVFPPKPIRDLDKHAYADLIHLQAIDRFSLDLNKTLQIDSPAGYLYTIQLIDDQQSNSDNFGASYMEVETRKLSRPADTFSKPLLKRFLQSVLVPSSHSSNPPSLPRWTIHPDLSLPKTITPKPIPVPSYKSLVKNYDQINRLATQADHHHLTEPHPKKRKKNTCQPLTPSQTSLQTLPPSYQDYPDHLKETLSSCAQLIEKQLEPNSLNYSIVEPCPQKKVVKKKRKKTLDSTDPSALIPINAHLDHPLTVNTQLANPADSALPLISATTPSTATKESKKTIKYPIEDLDLDPFTIIDGRYLRRANPTPLKLPRKPQPSQQKLGKKFAQRLKIWSFVNIFKLNERRCKFEEFDESLDDLTASLVKLILSQSGLRYPTTRPQRFTSISVLPFFATRPAQECRVMSIDEREYWVRKGLRFVNITRRLHEFALASAAGKRKTNRAALEEDWVMGLVEIMCHRGGIERLGCMARMLKYFFSTEGTLLAIDHTIDQDDELPDPGVTKKPQDSHPKTKYDQANAPQDGDSPLSNTTDDSLTVQDSEGSVDGLDKEEDVEPEAGAETADEDGRRYGRSIREQRSNPRMLKKTLAARFALLPIDDKLVLLEFLCDLATESDQVRNYMDECDEKLTVVRREKADVNKEKRKVLEELARLEARKAEAALNTQPASTTEPSSSTITEPSPTTEPDAAQPPPKQEPSTEAAPAQGSPEVMLGRGGDVSAEPEEARSSGAGKSSTHASAGSRSLSVDGPTKSPDTETDKKPAGRRRLDTAVRTATLLARQIKPPAASASPAYPPSDPQGKLAAEKAALDGQLFDVGLRELFFQERFRQLIGVSKLKPLGSDRFLCKYWWFDGVGGMQIHSNADTPQASVEAEDDEEGEEGEEETRWYAGCLFVSGPSIDEWQKIAAAHGGHAALFKRRFHEELGVETGPVDPREQQPLGAEDELKEQIVGVDEWAVYDTEQQVDELVGWLNGKGVRENALKANLKEWKEYIVDGFVQRRRARARRHQQQPVPPVEIDCAEGREDARSGSSCPPVDRRDLGSPAS
ncbi:hypothetical protein PTTG_02470 [Puccinia triticina 1-1 BBBD Race 1]|uniref:WAC domain-containing protein n=1 Tax=Puccinia triticina (isolate 1-1 / race 1 (BBBD)) TaxID=630390 RepID=A0A180H380_PUCT1|nr:hypothetical protein PTTG_02470 [Puccinia triticina 1-1 BBBD Race 1]